MHLLCNTEQSHGTSDAEKLHKIAASNLHIKSKLSKFSIKQKLTRAHTAVL